MDTKKFEYFCSRVAAGIGILILGFLSLYSLFYTEEFTANRTEELELVKDPVVLSLLSMAVVIFLLFYAAKIILKDEAPQKAQYPDFTGLFLCLCGNLRFYLGLFMPLSYDVGTGR